MSSRTPISVVMPVHNALPHLDEAVESILGQTFTDFDFVIYDDGSTDGSSARLEHWARQDSRIRLFRGEHNLGPAASSNKVVRLSAAPVVARMDADDISLPRRLEEQFDLLRQRADVGMVASVSDVIDARGRQLRAPELWRLTRNSWFTPFPHGSIMIRRRLFDELGGYRDACEFWEDLDLVIRASARTRILVIPHILYRYRHSTSSTRIASDQLRVEKALDLRYRSIARRQQNRSYDDLLADRPIPDQQRVDPRVFVSLGLLSLWSDQRPTFVRRFLSRARIRFDTATAIAIIWLAWARVMPRTVRYVMRQLSSVRNAVMRSRNPIDRPLEWLTPDKREAAAGGHPRPQDGA